VPRLLSIVALAALALVVSDAAPATKPGPVAGRLARAVSGDTLDVRVGGRVERIRLLGVISPAAGSCYARGSAATVRTLASSRALTVVPRGNRAYVSVAGRGDLGALLVRHGAAQVDSWGAGFSRFDSYVPVQRAAERADRGMWSACAADVAVTLEASDQARVGTDVTYVARVSNLGSRPASGVSLDLRPPATAELGALDRACTSSGWLATCSFGTIAGGATVTARLTVHLASAGLASTRASVRFAACLRTACGGRAIADADSENDSTAALTRVTTGDEAAGSGNCAASYPTVCIPPPPPDLNCADIPFRSFRVLRDISSPDPHDLDGNRDGVGCTFDDY
jgi:endonuclease YncB( thermonuclease family)